MVGAPVSERLLSALASSPVHSIEVYSGLFSKVRAEMDEVELRETLVAMGSHAASVHAPFGGDLDISSGYNDVRAAGLAAIRGAIDLAERFDAGLVVVHASAEPVADEDRPQRLSRAISSLQSLSGRCQESGIRIAIELLPRSCLGNTADELLEIVAALDTETFGVCLDVNHLMGRYSELPATVRQLAPHLLTLHLSDYDGVDEKHWMPGQGVIDWKAFLDALREIGYSGPFNYEAIIPGDTPEAKFAVLADNFRTLVA
jgi:sugar phosphate isomerase/epimerase